jgi:hypothetical protein
MESRELVVHAGKENVESFPPSEGFRIASHRIEGFATHERAISIAS